ncbi:amidohydrolase family protein [Dinoroseobacter sp. S375]|uniref:amidohydrolase family protein n=1 Tax=Dinoroseobacter sp. S375 TaxID=3415136 RepID=UPI003C7B62EC
MSHLRITNCHIHTFTADHVPRWYPHPLLTPFKAVPTLAKGLAVLLDLVGQERRADTVHRLYKFQETGRGVGQEEVFASILPFYPGDTRFVVLPMDMSQMGYGPVREDIAAQHDGLARLAAHPLYGPQVIPFATLVPGKLGAVAEFKRAIEDLGFRGLKLYPRLGYAPDHPQLMEEVYPYLAERNLPVLSHCARGGVAGRNLSAAEADWFTDPRAFIPVLEAFPELRVNLAHFGGLADWQAYVEEGIDPHDPQARTENWLAAILDLLRSGKYPGLYTDISYTVFNFTAFLPFLRVFLEDSRIAGKVLFGSDYYMTKQEQLSERAVCFGLRDALGEGLFRQIAETNPARWLGERAPGD